jgi:phytoene dehydrogenase-like protein
MYDAIVVGGGHNGLVAASYLAKAGKQVLLLEAAKSLGGATTSVKPFPDFEARLSRYSYLVSLLPDQIVDDLGINFKTISRSVSSYTPYKKEGKDAGLLVSRVWDKATEESFQALTGSMQEGLAWQEFYGEIAEFAKRIAPFMLQPLLSRQELKAEIAMDEVWDYLIEKPIGEEIERRFKNDVVKGVVLTDALIGTFVSAHDIQANICFLYHLIGNGTGEWKVPEGGMGQIVIELERIAKQYGAQILTNSDVTEIEESGDVVKVKSATGKMYEAKNLLFAAAPQLLAQLTGQAQPNFLEGSQIKINMLLKKLPRLKSGDDPRLAFAGTFHADESYSQLELALHEAKSGLVPRKLPLEMYCHTLTDSSILSPQLSAEGYHTLTLFGIHTCASLFDGKNQGVKDLLQQSAIDGLNEYLLDPIEDVLAVNEDGSLAIEVKSPLDLEADIRLPRGNIFHRDLDFPFKEEGENQKIWGAETMSKRIFLAGAGAQRGGGVSGIAGHNAAMAMLSAQNN